MEHVLSGPLLWLLLGACALTWLVFVFSGSQAAYGLLFVTAAALSLGLALLRQSIVLVFLFAIVALVGSDLSGQLGEGASPLGSLRVADVALAAAVAGGSVGLALDGGLRLPRQGALMVLSAVAITYATALWIANGAANSSFLRGDLRLLGVGVATWFVVATCTRGGPVRVLWGIVLLGPALALKAFVIAATNAYAIGEYDRLQASSLFDGAAVRVILIGGDTVLTLVPAIALAVGWRDRNLWRRLVLVACSISSVAALSLSGTRTSVLVATGLVVMTGAALMYLDPKGVSLRLVALGCVLLSLSGAALATGGVVGRLSQSDAPHVGLNFRRDEVRRFLDLAARKIVVGQGLGAAFVGKDVRGKPVEAGWAHEVPVWIALKTGVVGLVLSALAIGAIALRARARLACRDDALPLVLAGLAMIGGVLVLSLTLNRVALTEGIMPLVVGVALLDRYATASANIIAS